VNQRQGVSLQRLRIERSFSKIFNSQVAECIRLICETGSDMSADARIASDCRLVGSSPTLTTKRPEAKGS